MHSELQSYIFILYIYIYKYIYIQHSFPLVHVIIDGVYTTEHDTIVTVTVAHARSELSFIILVLHNEIYSFNFTFVYKIVLNASIMMPICH